MHTRCLTSPVSLQSPEACSYADRTRIVLKGVPVLDRIGNVVKHILLMDDRGADKGPGESEGSVHKEDVDGDLLKAFMTTDASAPDVPIVETSPGFQVSSFCLAFSWIEELCPLPLPDHILSCNNAKAMQVSLSVGCCKPPMLSSNQYIFSYA